MKFADVPVGFGMALAQNEQALAAYAAMTQQQKQTVLDKAHRAGSGREMHRIVTELANEAQTKAQ